MKNLIVGLIVTMIIVPVSTVMIFEPEVLGIGNIQPDYYDDIAPSSGMKTPKIFVFFHNDSWYCKGIPTPIIIVAWHGEDNPRGSGIKWYDVQYAKVTFKCKTIHAAVIPPDPCWYNPIYKSPWRDFQSQTTNTSTEFELEPDCIYVFRCRATDNAGNVEPWPEYWDSHTVSIGIEIPPGITDELRDEFEEGIERIQSSHYGTLALIKTSPKDELKEVIDGIRSNKLPVADAGGDCFGGIQRSPVIYEDIYDFIESIAPSEPYAEIEFNGSGSYDPDGELVSYLWDFGDGTYGNGVIVEHIYFVPGEYNVTLTVTDNFGATDQDSLICEIGIVC